MKQTKAEVPQIRSFWEKQSGGGDGGRFGAHSDQNIEDLESWYVIKYALEKYRPETLVDVGCGKGDRTKLFSTFVGRKTLGLDYSEGMIALAKRNESPSLKFEQADLLEEPSLPFEPEMIVSCRCLINLGTQANVVTVVRYFHRVLPVGGKLVLCECSDQGHVRLNRLRKEMGLNEIQTAWHNIDLDEEELARGTDGLFEFSDLSRLGMYYLMTRVVYPASIKPKDPDPKSGLNLAAAEAQKRVGIGVAEEYGRQYCVVATKVQ